MRIEAQHSRPLKRHTTSNKKEVYLNIFRSLYAEEEDEANEADEAETRQTQETCYVENDVETRPSRVWPIPWNAAAHIRSKG